MMPLSQTDCHNLTHILDFIDVPVILVMVLLYSLLVSTLQWWFDIFMGLEKNDSCLFLDVNGDASSCPPTIHVLIHQGFMHNSVNQKFFLANRNCFPIYSERTAITGHHFILDSLAIGALLRTQLVHVIKHGPRNLMFVLLWSIYAAFHSFESPDSYTTLDVNYGCYWTCHSAYGSISSSWSLTECVWWCCKGVMTQWMICPVVPECTDLVWPPTDANRLLHANVVR